MFYPAFMKSLGIRFITKCFYLYAFRNRYLKTVSLLGVSSPAIDVHILLFLQAVLKISFQLPRCYSLSMSRSINNIICENIINFFSPRLKPLKITFSFLLIGLLSFITPLKEALFLQIPFSNSTLSSKRC